MNDSCLVRGFLWFPYSLLFTSYRTYGHLESLSLTSTRVCGLSDLDGICVYTGLAFLPLFMFLSTDSESTHKLTYIYWCIFLIFEIHYVRLSLCVYIGPAPSSLVDSSNRERCAAAPSVVSFARRVVPSSETNICRCSTMRSLRYVWWTSQRLPPEYIAIQNTCLSSFRWELRSFWAQYLLSPMYRACHLVRSLWNKLYELFCFGHAWLVVLSSTPRMPHIAVWHRSRFVVWSLLPIDLSIAFCGCHSW